MAYSTRTLIQYIIGASQRTAIYAQSLCTDEQLAEINHHIANATPLSQIPGTPSPSPSPEPKAAQS